jgi:anaerobic magnesium-protoporphyrin IX monomethyl ester cyclase
MAFTKVLLLNPEKYALDGSVYPPLGLLYLASTVRQHGYEVEVIDGVVEGEEAILERIIALKPDVIGVPCLTPCRHYSLGLAKKAKQLMPHAITVLGNAHATIMGRQLIENYPFVDLVVAGEGEMTFLDIVKGKSFQDIEGIIYRSQDKAVKTQPRQPIENLDELPFPAWDMIKFNRYPPIGRGVVNGVDLAAIPQISICTTRGCRGQCSFCSNWWVFRKYRSRSAENIVAEIELLATKYGMRHFWIIDDAFLYDRGTVSRFCQLIQEKQLKIAFWASARADSLGDGKVDLEILTRLREAGCYELHFGIESGSQQILERIGKGIDVETNRQAILMTKQAGIRAFALMMTGNISETIDTINASVDFLKETEPDQFLAGRGLILFPGTRDYQYAKRKGYIDDDFWLRDEPDKNFYLDHSQFQTECFRSALNRKKKLSRLWLLNYLDYFLYLLLRGQLPLKYFVWSISPKWLQDIYMEKIKPILTRRQHIQVNLIE